MSPDFDLQTALERDMPHGTDMVVSRTSVDPVADDNQSALAVVMHDDHPGALLGPLCPAIERDHYDTTPTQLGPPAQSNE